MPYHSLLILDAFALFHSLLSLLCSVPDTIMTGNKCSHFVPRLTIQRGYFHDHDLPFIEDHLRRLG